MGLWGIWAAKTKRKTKPQEIKTKREFEGGDEKGRLQPFVTLKTRGER